MGQKLKKAKDGCIPFEIQEEIMKRLPVKSLIRFRSVSKSWKSLIHSPKFIVDYRGGQPRLLVRHRVLAQHHRKTRYVWIADDDTFPQHKFYLNVPTIEFGIHRLTGTSSHGLICYYNGTNVLLLWNPTIRKTVFIDMPYLLDSHRYETTIDFGVCPSTYDPKLVKIICNRELMKIFTLEVFTLSSGVWRSPNGNLPRQSVYFTRFQVYVDGIYWSAYDYVPLPDGYFGVLK